ncbi:MULTISPECIES: ketopantoate reductase family protein [Bifidobacterium]|uniref:ketopantoate reductase family protein n=1 Tax=Bifidobacterium TaxID=1678 RepID=UPI001BDCA228|nr:MULTISPECIES: ketopantoate reductase family protein [Bifidobacterium]MBT1162849.1 ketopantoate reductase family protein [Bifidobacterium sp. SO1]MBW3077981.1 ketopantoate reductase family protein [Bifidobacterium simiiventris]
MRYTVIGAGAMGLRYGILLQEHTDAHVDFIDAWAPHIDKIREQGGVYVSRDHENRRLIPINLYTPEEYDGDPDVWIIFMKQMQLEEMLKRCAHLFKDHQVAFSAMNGWGHFEKIAQYFSEDRIYGGTALVATVLNGPGDVDFIGKSGAGTMHMCAMTNEVTDIEKAIFADFQKANLNPEISDDFKGMCMAKIVFNSVVNTLCTMYQITMGQFISYPGARDMAMQLINEAYDACERAGIKLINTRAEELESVDYVSRTGNPLHYPSMYQDMSRGRKTEVDYINGYIAKIGREHDYVCRTHEFLTHGVHLAELAFQYHHQNDAK